MEKPVAGTLEFFNYMKKLDFFKSMSKNALWPLATLAVLRSFKPEELLIHENSDPVGIFLLKKGNVQVFRTVDGSEYSITALGPDQIIGEISVIDKLKTTASVRALEDVECLFISAWDFTTQIHAYPEIALELLPILTERIRIMHGIII